MNLPEMNKIKAWLREDWKIKLTSLILSIFLWLFVDSLSVEEMTISLPVQYKNLPSGLVVLEDQLPLVSLKIHGKKSNLKKIDLTHTLIVQTDLSKAKIGISHYPIELINMSPESDLKILPNRKTVVIKIDRNIQKKLAIKPRISGSPKEGFVLENISLEKQKILVGGPASILSSIQFIETSVIDISGADHNITKIVHLFAPTKTRIIGSSQLSVQIKIAEREITKEEVFTVTLTNINTKLKTTDKPEIVLLLTIPGRYENNFQEQIKVTADCANITHSGTYRIPLKISAPKLIKLLNAPSFISVKFIEQTIY